MLMDYDSADSSMKPAPKPKRGARACTVCRRLKMKCVGAENGPPCRRCLSGNHDCVFEESNRGKRSTTLKKHDVLSRSLKKMEQTLDTVIRSMNNPALSAELIDPAPSSSPSPHPPKSALMLPPPAPHSPKVPSLPDNTLNPLGLLAEASLANTNNLPTSSDTNPSLGVASRNYFKPGPMTILPLRRLYIERQIQPEMLSFVNTDQVVDLFNIYFENLHTCANLLDPNFHSPALVCSRSPFLLTTICAIASKFYTSHPDLHPRLTDLTNTLAFSVPAKGYKSVEIVQAYLLLSLWGCGAVERFEMDKTWMLLGMAIRMATDLNLHRKTSILTADTQNGKTLDMELHNRERTWIMCFVLDRSFSSQMGKPYTIREDYIIRHVKEFYSSPNATEMDIAMSGYVQLQQVISHCLDFLYSGTDTPSGLQRKCDYMQVIKSFDAQLRAWWLEWGEMRKWQSPYVQTAVDFFYNYAVLVLNSFGLQNALESLSSLTSSGPGSRSSSLSSPCSINTSYFFSKVYSAAHRCAILVRDKLGPSGYTRFLPDTLFVQMSYAVLSLLKLIRPELQPYISNEKGIINLVKEVANVMSDAAVNALHTPALYGHFLMAIIDAKVGGGGSAGGVSKSEGEGGGGSGSGSGSGSGGGGGGEDTEMSPSGASVASGSRSGSGSRVASRSGYHTTPPSAHSSTHYTRSPPISHPYNPSPSTSSTSTLTLPSHHHHPHSQQQQQHHTPTPTLSHASASSGLSHLDSTPLTTSSVLSLSEYQFSNSNGETGPSPFGVDLAGFPGSLPAGIMPSNNNTLGLGAASGGVAVGMSGEEGSTGVMGGGAGGGGGGVGGLSMEDVLSSVFWDSMVVPGFNTLDGFSGGFVFGSGGSGLITPRHVPG